jgi:hypothetical protein
LGATNEKKEGFFIEKNQSPAQPHLFNTFQLKNHDLTSLGTLLYLEVPNTSLQIDNNKMFSRRDLSIGRL